MFFLQPIEPFGGMGSLEKRLGLLTQRDKILRMLPGGRLVLAGGAQRFGGVLANDLSMPNLYPPFPSARHEQTLFEQRRDGIDGVEIVQDGV